MSTEQRRFSNRLCPKSKIFSLGHQKHVRFDASDTRDCLLPDQVMAPRSAFETFGKDAQQGRTVLLELGGDLAEHLATLAKLPAHSQAGIP